MQIARALIKNTWLLHSKTANRRANIMSRLLGIGKPNAEISYLGAGPVCLNTIYFSGMVMVD